MEIQRLMELKRKRNTRFRNINDFPKYIERLDEKYDSEDLIFEGDSFIIDKEEFNVVIGSKYGKGSNHLYDIQENFGQNCYIPNRTKLFLQNVSIILTKKDYKNEYFQFTNSELKRKGVMTLARIQPLCSKYNINIGYYKQDKKRNFT